MFAHFLGCHYATPYHIYQMITTIPRVGLVGHNVVKKSYLHSVSSHNRLVFDSFAHYYIHTIIINMQRNLHDTWFIRSKHPVPSRPIYIHIILVR